MRPGPIAALCAALLLTLSTVSPARAQRPTVALALGGGGARAAAEIGVLRALTRANIKIDYVVGCSMGAVIGSLFCAGVPLDKIEALMLSRKGVFHAFIPSPLPLRLMGHGPAFAAHFARVPKEIGLYSGKQVVDFINAQVPSDQRLVEKLKTRFYAVAVNLLDARTVTLDKGDLGEAVYASSALPGLFRASYHYPGLELVDGGWRENVPVVTARSLGADIVIAVNCDEKLDLLTSKQLKQPNVYVNRLTTIIMDQMDRNLMEQADVKIWPEISDVSIFSRSDKNMARCIKIGETAGEAAVPEIEKKITDWAGKKEESRP